VESVDRAAFKEIPLQGRLEAHSDGKEITNGHRGHIAEAVPATVDAHGYARYVYSESGISPISAPGAGALVYTATGLEHNQHGHPDYEPEDHVAQMKKRFHKLDTAMHELPQPERYGDADAKIGLIGWGSTEGAIQEAVDRARAQGHKVASLHPRVLSPLPDDAIRAFIGSVETLIVPEGNYSGQFANLLGAKYGILPIRINKYGGIPFTAGDILRAIEEVC
jgi:2-oxoglutarate ferredoxin oxidoreductase subunit alpha